MKVQEVFVNMQNNSDVCVIGGYDSLASSFLSEINKKSLNSIFINVGDKKINKSNIYNFKIFELKNILNTLEKYTIKNIIFLGKINRPNIKEFKNDGEIEKHLPFLLQQFAKGDGMILSGVIKIFIEKGFNVLSPTILSNKFNFKKNELNNSISKFDKIDITKSVKILNDLSKYDNAQSMVSVNGYIIAIEAAEGTDSLLRRVISIRKNLKQINMKAGILTKVPKNNQSKLVDLPVIGPKTIKLVKMANLNGLAIDPDYTLLYKKDEIKNLTRKLDIKIYNVR